jgi:hypothetical protein
MGRQNVTFNWLSPQSPVKKDRTSQLAEVGSPLGIEAARGRERRQRRGLKKGTTSLYARGRDNGRLVGEAPLA